MSSSKSSHEIRSQFLKYFKTQKHEIVPSSRLIPEDDPTLLFTNAGMNQFKNMFLGLEERFYKRAASSQKCVRAGGKHNDLENVGHTARHHTFFEMLGNFSFGDYFKDEAIHFAWEFITKEIGLPKDKLYVTVFETDDEAADIWNKQIGVPKDRIFRLGEKDNFWRMGDSGPCGPCTEIFYDLGPETPGDPKENVMGGSGDRFMEFWNLVFMQYSEDGKGGRTRLPKPSVDTGMGLERLTTILQGQNSNYHTDVFMDLMSSVSQVSGREYVKDIKKLSEKIQETQNQYNIALRVLADHARSATFLIADGILPSNEGRGYVLRRILRRAIRFGRKLSQDQSLLPIVAAKVIEKMCGAYPELTQLRSHIIATIQDEEKRFLTTLDQGTQILSDELKKISQSGTLNGDFAFKLYDTYGFPLDLTRIMSEEMGFKVDEVGFDRAMEKSKEKARSSWKGKGISGDAAHLVSWSQNCKSKIGATVFQGDQTLRIEGEPILSLSDGSQEAQDLQTDQTGIIVFKTTPFYAEGGGQIGDHGLILGPKGVAEVIDCTKQNDVYLHHVRINDGTLKVSDKCHLQVTASTRRATAANHSATHLLHSALKQVLGSSVNQAGSHVDSERLRFDFTYNKPLTSSEIQQIESLVSEQIQLGHNVKVSVMKQKEAIESGAVAMFGEKYGDEVRVVKMGGFSMELCGGTHVANTSSIRMLKIVSESGVSSGVRRIEAITGEIAFRYFMSMNQDYLASRSAAGISENYQKTLNVDQSTDRVQLSDWILSLLEDKKTLERQLQAAKVQQIDVHQLISNAKVFNTPSGVAKLVMETLELDDRKALSDLSDQIRDRIQSGIVILLGKGDTSHPLIVNVSKNLNPQLSAGQILSEISKQMGGKGGGRPDFAQGAVPDRSLFAKAKLAACQLLDISG